MTIMISSQIKRILFSLFVLILGKVSTQSNVIEGICNWNMSSGKKLVPASVFPVRFFACKGGKLTWKKPYGGVQITFQSEVPKTTQGSYQVCLTAKVIGINIFFKLGNKFKTLRRHDDRKTSSEMCVLSDTKIIFIFLEATDDVSITKSAIFTYRTLFKLKGKGRRRPKECKPCRPQEVIRSFCDSDFAVLGYVKSVIPIGDGRKRGEAMVVANKILHQTVEIFQKSPSSSEIIGNVNFPLYCHWKKRSKHGYLFTGNLKEGLGPVIHCRIKFNLWRKLHKRVCKIKPAVHT